MKKKFILITIGTLVVLAILLTVARVLSPTQHFHSVLLIIYGYLIGYFSAWFYAWLYTFRKQNKG